jgi:hypothetical protein
MNMCYHMSNMFELNITAWTGTWVPGRLVLDVPEVHEGPNGVGILWEGFNLILGGSLEIQFLAIF